MGSGDAVEGAVVICKCDPTDVHTCLVCERAEDHDWAERLVPWCAAFLLFTITLSVLL